MATLKHLRQVVHEDQLDENAKQRLIGLTAAGLLSIGGLTHDLHSGSEEKYHQHMKKTYGVEKSDNMLTSMKKIIKGPRTKQ